MQYQPDDDGPFYLSEEKKNELKHNCEIQQMITKKYTRAQLIDKIKHKTNLPTVRGTLKDVQDQAIKIDIPIDFQRQKVREGWIGKAKGMIQILWERGWIDPSKNVSEYSVNGKKIRKGENAIVPGSSLKKLVDDLPDFKEEITLLQFRAEQLGVKLRCSPKYHPEIAGEAVEFCWASSKNTYRRKKIEDKRTKAKFIELVDEVQKVNTKELVRTFGRRLRRYILAYFAIEKAKEEQAVTDTALYPDDTENSFHLPEMSCQLVERLVRKRKSHRNIADQEKKFLNFVLPLIQETSKNLN